jgi:hypothetical protein
VRGAPTVSAPQHGLRLLAEGVRLLRPVCRPILLLLAPAHRPGEVLRGPRLLAQPGAAHGQEKQADTVLPPLSAGQPLLERGGGFRAPPAPVLSHAQGAQERRVVRLLPQQELAVDQVQGVQRVGVEQGELAQVVLGGDAVAVPPALALIDTEDGDELGGAQPAGLNQEAADVGDPSLAPQLPQDPGRGPRRQQGSTMWRNS